MLEHGGRLHEAARRHGIPPGEWLDLSTGINPHGWPVPGLPPEAWLRLPEEEDGLEHAARHYYGCASLLPVAGSQAAIQALPPMRLPCRVGIISNHTDLDPLRHHPGVDLRLIGPGEPIPPAELIILPGSKHVRADLAFLRAQGWEEAIRRHLRYGGKLIGLCGGYQMLGRSLADPYGIEGKPGTSVGLGWLEIDTVLEPEKQLRRVTGRLCLDDAPLTGYEIHAGVTRGEGLARPAALLERGPDGAISPDGQVLGIYVHGLFDRPEACAALLSWAGLKSEQPAPDMAWLREQGIERLADNVEEHLDMERIITILDGRA